MSADINLLKVKIKELETENRDLKDAMIALLGEKNHLEDKLSMASRLKYHLRPNIYPAFPDVPDLDIFADTLEVRHSGGDYHDFFRIDGDHIGIVVADIFDGGTAAALYMVAFKMYMTSQLIQEESIEEKIQNVNDYLCWKNDDNLCLSAWYGVYEISTGNLKAVNAGHERVILLTKDGAEYCRDESVSYLLGVMEGMQYKSFDLHLDPGDKLLLYTDGVIGAADAEGNIYGQERLKKAFHDTLGEDAQTTIEALESDLSTFLNEGELNEDATFLCVGRKEGK